MDCCVCMIHTLVRTLYIVKYALHVQFYTLTCLWFYSGIVFNCVIIHQQIKSSVLIIPNWDRWSDPLEDHESPWYPPLNTRLPSCVAWQLWDLWRQEKRWESCRMNHSRLQAHCRSIPFRLSYRLCGWKITQIHSPETSWTSNLDPGNLSFNFL